MTSGTSTRADAIVVLGCRVLPSGRLLRAAEGRVAAAATAFHAGLAPRIVTSGGRRWGARVEAIALAGALIQHGVPEAAIVTELLSLTTIENAVFTAALLRKLGARSAILVTCSWHAPRALTCFRAAGVDVTAWPGAGGAADLFNRCAETVRHAYDAIALRQSSVLASNAETFFGAAPGGLREGEKG